jgi:thymidylate synthase
MRAYLDLLRKTYVHGRDHKDRTGTGRRSIYGVMVRFNLQEGWPLVTTREIRPHANLKELAWFVQGKTDVKSLQALGSRFWDRWAVTEEHLVAFVDKYWSEETPQGKALVLNAYRDRYLGQLGPMYGRAWRDAPCSGYNTLWPVPASELSLPSDRRGAFSEWYLKETQALMSDRSDQAKEEYLRAFVYQGVDQLHNLIEGLKTDPDSSRHCINAWIPEWIPFEHLSPQENVLLGRGALAPCHVFQQYFVEEIDGEQHLSLMLTQRSLDLPVGGCSNLAQYSALLMLVAHVTGMVPKEFIWSIGDCHIYLNQLEKVPEQLERDPLPLPKLTINPELKDIFAVTPEDFIVSGYEYHPPIDYPVSV